MATELYDKDGNKVPSRTLGGAIFMLFLCTGFTIMIVIMVATFIGYNPFRLAALAAPTPAGAIGNQAPPSVRGTNADPIVPPTARATPIPGIAQSEAEGLRLYQTTVAAPQAAPHVVAPPLPQNSVGQPVIDQVQQAQEQQSLGLAEQEGAAAADQQLAAQRAAADAAALSRAPDVSAADAAAELHRDPCHVPHADPQTCAQGLYKPTPVNVP